MRTNYLLILLAFSLLVSTSCALRPPDGTKELMQDVVKDRYEKAESESRKLVGAPTFLKVRVYPKVCDGNIHGAHWVFLQVDREPIDLEGLVKKLED